MSAKGDDARVQLALLFADVDGLIELRWHDRGRWRQRFVPAAARDVAMRRALRLAGRADVYVGVVGRRRRGGGRADLMQDTRVVWADLDDPDALARLRRFRPRPSLVVSSGTAGHVHAYWRLQRPLRILVVEQINRALAAALCADEASCEPARVLRVAGSSSHKHEPPAPVTMIEHRDMPIAVDDLLAAIGPLPPARAERVSPAPAATRLDRVAPEVYVRVLTGQRVGRDRKVRCPLHDDRNASLHVYPSPARGWYCFGCRRGGRIYQLAAALWNRPLQGPRFLELRRDLQLVLDLATEYGESRPASGR